MSLPFLSPRMQREARTVEAMIHLYCRDHHGGHPTPCAACRELLAYAHSRLHRCPFQERKTTCGTCPVHCYAPGKQQQIREVMRYSGPRMLRSHPMLALRHLFDGLRKPRTPG